MSSTILAGQLPGEKLRRSNEFEGDLIYTYYCSAIRLEGPNFGPVGPPLRMLRPGRSGPLWVPLCSGRAGRGLWVCSVGRADRPGLLPSQGYGQAQTERVLGERAASLGLRRRPQRGGEEDHQGVWRLLGWGFEAGLHMRRSSVRSGLRVSETTERRPNSALLRHLHPLISCYF